MCRISGIISKSSNANEYNAFIRAMSDAMHRGGPDDNGVYISDDNKIALAHRRLSILDLSSLGHQPMFSNDKKIVLSFNGEIYNFNEIKNQLKNYSFQTNTDSEVIIAAYHTWGEQSFSLFKGMFAFILHDISRNLAFVVRDSLGIKPIYIYENEQIISLSSELRAFKKLPIQLEENPNWETYFLVFGFIPEPHTIYKDVKMLPKSHFLKINLQTFQSSINYFSPKVIEQNIEINNIKTQLKHELSKSVHSHLISDAPIGVFLSGGIDSSLISILASQHTTQQINTLSLNFDINSYNESYYQDIIVKKIKSKHTREQITFEDFDTSMTDYLEAMDQPTSDAINIYFISLASKKAGLKTVLSGLGADEYFGGYPSFKRANTLHFIQKYIPNSILKNLKILGNYKFNKLEYLSINDVLGVYLCNRAIFSPNEISNLLSVSKKQIYDLLSPFCANNEINNESNFDKTVWAEENIYMQNQLLRDSDVMSMWHGIELRVPFVDSNLKNYVLKIPSEIKNSKIQKQILIDAFARDLPREIWDRPKKGFTLPLQDWILKSKEILETVSQDPSFQPIVEQFRAGKLHWSRIWVLYLICVWREKLKH